MIIFGHKTYGYGTKYLAVLPLYSFLLMDYQSKSLAETFSKPNIGVKITFFGGFFDHKEIGTISGVYESTPDIKGVLFAAPLPIPEPIASDVADFNFIDTEGKERCYGSSHMSSGAVSSWEVKGAVPGFRCSTIGKIYRFNFGR
jgi:hypothetical protein